MPIDLNLLLAPLNEASPCGEDLLFSADFDAIQQARRFDDPSLDQGDWVTELKEADWDFVIERSSSLLATQTKDLRLAVWLTEALGIEEGLNGLASGFALLAGLCDRYWDSVHPLPESDDMEYRLGNVAWLVSRSAELLRDIPLTQSQDGNWRTLDWEIATHVAQAIRRDPDHANEIARGKPSIEQIEIARRATPVAFYHALLAGLRAFEAAMRDLERALDQHAGEDAPSFRLVKDAYENVQRLAERFAREAGVNPEQAAGASAPAAQANAPAPERVEPTFGALGASAALSAEENAVSTTTPAPTSPAGLQTRAQAVEQLRAVAAFFRRTEPHSPVAYLADKAAEWAEMPLHQWLAAVVKDDGSLTQLRELLGVKPDGG